MARKSGSSGEKTVAALRVAALHLFARRGYAAVSMREIAAQVDIRASALYNYWPTKQDLLVDLLDEHMRDLLAAWQKLAPLRGDPACDLDTFVRFHIRYHIDRPDEVFVAYMELRALEPDRFIAHEKLRRRYEEILRDVLRRGRRADVFTVADVKVTAMAIIAMLTGVNIWYRSGGRLSRAAIENIYTQMVARSVGLDGVSDAAVAGQVEKNAGDQKNKLKSKPKIKSKPRIKVRDTVKG